MANFRIETVPPGDGEGFAQWLALFADAFDDRASYLGAPPSPAYRDRLLASDSFIALRAVDGAQMVGALAAYVLQKFEQQRSEVYIYDLAVQDSHRRLGIATALIERLRLIAREKALMSFMCRLTMAMIRPSRSTQNSACAKT